MHPINYFKMRNLIIILLSMFCYVAVKGQIMIEYHVVTPKKSFKTNMYRYNAETKKYESTKYIKKGEDVFIRVHGVNTLIYTPKITWNERNFITLAPTSMNTLFGLEEKGGTAEAAKTESEKGGKTMMKANTLVQSSVPPVALDSSTSSVADTAATKVLLQACHGYCKNLERIQQLDITKEHLIRELVSPGLTNTTKSKSVLSVLPSNQALKDIISDYNRSYENIKDEYQKQLDQIQDPNARKKAIDALDYMKKAHEKIEDGQYDALAMEIIQIKEKLTDSTTFVFESGVFVPKSDQLDIIINFERPKDSKAPDLDKSILKKRIRGGLKVDFSVGPALSFGPNAENVKFEPLDTPGDSVTIKSYRTGLGVRPGIAAFIHISPRVHKDISPVFSFGIGADFDGALDTNVSYYVGGGAILGKKKRVIIQLGLSLIRTNRLNPLIENDGEYKKEFVNQLDNDGLINSLKPSGFFSLSYNITGGDN